MKSLYTCFLRRGVFLMALPLLIACASKNAVTPSDLDTNGWAGTWATAVEKPGNGDMPSTSLSNRSLRQIIHVSIGGETLRLRLSNVQSSSPVSIKGVYIAAATYTYHIDPATAAWLTFGSERATTIEPGKEVLSDDINYHLRPGQLLAVTINYGDETPAAASCHRGSRTTSYIIPGESTPESDFGQGEEAVHWYNIASVDVQGEGQTAIAILGNSITDGRGSTTDAQDRWTDILSNELQGDPTTAHIGVLNLGIGGNCVVRGGLSEPGVVRFDRDILGQTGLSAIIIFEGVNDVGSHGHQPETYDQLIQAYRQFISKGHEAGLKVYGATITPFKNSFYYNESSEAMRQRVNAWIRTKGEGHFDGCIDFDQAVRDPSDPAALRADWQDDWLHLNASGYAAMGKFAAEFIKKLR